MPDDERKPANPWKPFIGPFLLATSVAIVIAWVAPEMGPFAWGSAWIGIMLVLSIWNVIARR